MNTVRPIPEGYHSVTPYLCVSNAAEALAFYEAAFGARELFRHLKPDGRIGHAEIQIGDSRIMLADAFPEHDFHTPAHYGGSPIAIHLYVEDVDAIVNQAIRAGAHLVRQVSDQFYGDRNGTVDDPFGHRWFISTHVEDVSPDETERRAAAQAAVADNRDEV